MSKYKIQGTDMDEYFNTGNSVITAPYTNLPFYDPATEEYEKITSNIGYSIAGIDVSELYDIKSKFQEISTTSTTENGTLSIPTWAKGVKVFLGTMQGTKGNDSAPASDGKGGAGRGPFSVGVTGEAGLQGLKGNDNHIENCPIANGNKKREKFGGGGGPGGDGGPGGPAGLGAAGGRGGTGGRGASGGQGGAGVRYSSPSIINLDSIRGNGINYSVSENAVSLSSTNFIYAANRGSGGKDANNPNAGNNGNDAKGGNNGKQGQQGFQGNKGQDGGTSCGDNGSGDAGTKGGQGGQGGKGDDATAGNNGNAGDDGNNGDPGADGNVSVTGPSDLGAQSYSTNSHTSNKIIVHFFID
jgi:hypothetical protein